MGLGDRKCVLICVRCSGAKPHLNGQQSPEDRSTDRWRWSERSPALAQHLQQARAPQLRIKSGNALEQLSYSPSRERSRWGHVRKGFVHLGHTGSGMKLGAGGERQLRTQ